MSQMPQLSNKLPPLEKDVIVASFLSKWESSSRKLIGIDHGTYLALFDYLTIVHTVSNSGSSRPLLVVVDREEAINLTRTKYDMHNGSHIHRS